jgi:hypothetical protein
MGTTVPARLVLLGLLAAVAAGCGKVEARAPGPAPALLPPTPPSKLVIPSQIPEPSPPAADPVSDPVAPPTSTPQPNRANRPPPGTSPAPPAQDPQVLRTNSNVAELERLTRASLGRAQRDIGAVRRTELGTDAKTQYDEVQRFIRSSEEALKLKNYIFAQQLADKAARLASLLVKGGAPSVA